MKLNHCLLIIAAFMMFSASLKAQEIENTTEEVNSIEAVKPIDELKPLDEAKPLDELKPLDEAKPLDEVKTISKPKIGLVLSGGGAKGLAHVGVIKALEKAGIEVDMICGTSMGAIVGALYATGYNADQIETMVLNIDWNKVLTEDLDHRRMDYFERNKDGRYLIKTEVGKARSGLVDGNLALILLSELYVPAHNIDDFSKLKRSFACVATDLETGKPVVINKGNLAEAVRCSMSYPMVFRPAELDDKLLIDGGIVSNLPAKELKDMGADIIIGVNVGSPAYKREKLRSIPSILTQCVSFLNEQNAENHKKTCDILIEPDITTFETFSFKNLPAIIKSGEQACEPFQDELKKIAEKVGSSASNEETLPDYNEEEKIHFSSVEIVGAEKSSTDYLFHKIGELNKKELSIKEIKKIAERMIGTGLISKAFFRIIPAENSEENNEKKLIFIVKTSEAYEHNIGIRYEEGQGAQLLLNQTIKNKFFAGSRTSIDLVIAKNSRLTTSEELSEIAKTGFGSEIEFDSRRRRIDSLYDKQTRLNFDEDLITVTFSLHKRFSGSSIIKGGVMKRFGASDLNKIENGINYDHYEYTGLFGKITTDNLDRAIKPRVGNKFNFTYMKSIDKANFCKNKETDEFSRYTADYKGYMPLSKKTTLGVMASWGKLSDDTVPGSELFYLGGKNIFDESGVPFYGMKYQELCGHHVVTAGIEIRRDLTSDMCLYLRGNRGNVTNDEHDLFDNDNKIYGGEIACSMQSILGNIELSYGTNDYNHDKLLLLSLGNSF